MFGIDLKNLRIKWNRISGKPDSFTPSAHAHAEYIPNTEKAAVNGVATLDSAGKVPAIQLPALDFIPTSEKAAVNGVATLDHNVKIPLSQLPDSILGQVEYKGLWNAATNTPALALANVSKGNYYIVEVAGTYNSLNFQIGDWVISDGVNWTKVDNTDAVSSVFGRTGNITAQAGDYSLEQITGLVDALAAKLNSSQYTAPDVLAKLLTVDGSGSGLDADKLKGFEPQSSESDTTLNRILKVGAFGIGTTGVNILDFTTLENYNNMFFRVSQDSGEVIDAPTSSSKYFSGFNSRWATATNKQGFCIIAQVTASNKYFARTRNNSGWTPWVELYHSGNHPRASITVSAVEPSTPQDGDIWIIP